MTSALEAIGNFFSSDAPSGGEAPAPSQVQVQGGTPTPSQGQGQPPAANPSLAAQAAQIQSAIAKLSSTQPQNDPMMYFQAAAGLGSPTQSGSFFEGLGKMNKGVGDYMAQNRELQMKGLGSQAALLGVQADLPLKEMQARMQEQILRNRLNIGQALGAPGGSPAAPGGSPAGIGQAPGATVAPVGGQPPGTVSGAPLTLNDVVGAGTPPRDIQGATPQEKMQMAKQGLSLISPHPGTMLENLMPLWKSSMVAGDDKSAAEIKGMMEMAQKAMESGKGVYRGPGGALVIGNLPGSVAAMSEFEREKAMAGVPAKAAEIGIQGKEHRKTDAAKIDREAEYQTVDVVIDGVKHQVPRAVYNKMFPAGMQANAGSSPSSVEPTLAKPGEVVFDPKSAPVSGVPKMGERLVDKELAAKDATHIEETSKEAAAADRTISGIRTAMGQIDQFPTDKLGPTRQWLGQWLIAGGADEKAVNAKLGKIQSAEELSKTFFDIASKRTRELGGREPGFVLQMIATNSPNLDLMTDTNKFMLSSFAADAQRTKDLSAEQQRYLASSGNLRGFTEWFDKVHPVESYVAKAYTDAGQPVHLPPGDAGLKMAKTLSAGTKFVMPGSKTIQEIR